MQDDGYQRRTMASDGLTFALAVFGAVTGGASTAAQITTAFRDRPRLRLDGHTTTSVEHAPKVMLTVINEGHRATTIREVGFYAHRTTFEVFKGEDADEA